MSCSVCNDSPGRRTEIVFLDSGAELTVSMCNECYEEFSTDERIDVERVEE